MSILILGYRPDGSRIVRDQGPAHASMSVSRGGLTLGQALTHVTVTHKGNHGEPTARAVDGRHKYQDAPRCGLPLHFSRSPVKSSGLCHRTVDHRGKHASREAMEAANLRRRMAIQKP